ncbi:MAG: aspartyl/asparaginyl beta-hydroxylase domain-containing protein [Bacteroidota bacterium]
MKKTLKLALKLILVGVLIYLFPRFMIFYLLCGLYDVSRNRPLTWKLLQKYFLSKGIVLWILSPFNILMDLLTLPYINKGIYRLEDLPGRYQDEVNRLIEVVKSADIDALLREKTTTYGRSMIFFKWYRKNIKNEIVIPEFHEDYRFITTVGISTFNKKVSTSAHFGPLRASLRVLYNINLVQGREAWIEVGDHKHYWSDSQLFIFDDTLLHQSVNQTDDLRYCLFVDIIRPSVINGLMRQIVTFLHITMSSVNGIFYKNWKKIH